MSNKTCACGCGEQIPISPLHPTRVAKFIKGHWARTKAFRKMKETTRSDPPPDWEAPSGFCECGCGGKTPIVRVTARTRGQYRGFPLRFIHGHHSRLLHGPQTSAWKGGRTMDGYGYVIIRVGNRYRPEHVLVWEKKHGPVPRGSIVHHLNHVKTDNRLSNLLCMTRGQHRKLHEEHDRANKTGHYKNH